MSDQQLSRNEPDPVAPANERDEVWRREIQHRVDRYRTRRGRRIEGSYSMRFPFPAWGEVSSVGSSAMPVSEPPERYESPIDRGNGLSDVSLDLPPSNGAPTVEGEEVTASANHPGVSEIVSGHVGGNPYPTRSKPVLEDDPPRLVDQDTRVQTHSQPRPRATRKVIAFPRQLMATPDVAYRIADPVVPEQPRILDVPEELEAISAISFLDGLTFEGKVPPLRGSQEHIELPFRPVTMVQRSYAVAVDALLVGGAGGIFAALVHKLTPGVSMTKPLLATAASVLVLLWFVYQYLLLVYGGGTPGMRASKTRLVTFAGKIPEMRQRRNRVLGLCLSTASLAMGLLWALVDVDALCWHDRMSQTYLTSL